MLNKTAAVKALMLFLSASAVLVPIVHGLAVYGWNIQAMVMPLYSPPKIDFRLEPSGLRFDRGQLRVEFKLTNLGEVKVVLEGLNAEVYGPDGKALVPASLDKAVVSLPGPTQTLTLKIEVNEAVLSRITSYFMEGRDRVNIEIKGKAILRVFGSRVIAPISSSFEVSLTDFLKQQVG
jgi:LEA14-like dessication related protein